MNMQLQILVRNDHTSLPRVLRLVSRQGYFVKKLVMQPLTERNCLQLLLLLETEEMPTRLMKLLQKQIVVFEVTAQQSDIALAG